MKRRLLAIAALLTGITAAQTPLTLDQAIQEAMAHNLTLAAEKLSISVAEARAITAALRPNPVLSVSAQTLNLLGADYSSVSPLGPNQVNFHVDLPLETAGKRQKRVALAREDRTLAEWGVREIMRQVIAAVQSAFVDVLQAQNNLALAQENLSSLERVVAINEDRLKAGDASRVEVDRSRVAAIQFRTAVRQAEAQVEQTKLNLQQLLGRKPFDPAFEIAGALRQDALSLTQKELLDRALTQRPDYRGQNQAQARSKADLTLQLANAKVDWLVGAELTRQAAYGIQGNSLGFSLSVPLPVWSKNQGEIARATREITQAGARKVALESVIGLEVEKSYRQYLVSRQLAQSFESDLLEKARSVRETTEFSYRRGEASLVEFLDAQRAYNDAVQSSNDARAQYARSLYTLDTVTGATVAGN